MNLPLVYRLPVYFKSVTKNAITFKKKTKRNDQEKRKKFLQTGVQPKTFNV